MANGIHALAALVFLAMAAGAEPLTGRWLSDDDPALAVSLTETRSGEVSGSLVSGAETARIAGRRTAAGFSGTLEMDGLALPCSARVQGAQLLLTVGAPSEADSLTLRRATSESVAGAEPSLLGAAPAQASRDVVINATRLSAQDLARIEATHGLRIADANYWYDPVSGGWGAQGGPTAGFLPPGIALGGPLRADSSGGDSGVFVNGREAHALDVLALARLIDTPILPARYFLTAQGLAGFEGGPPLWNLLAIAAAASGGGGGGDTSWNSRLSSGIDGGDTGAVFLPGGGIVSYGN